MELRWFLRVCNVENVFTTHIWAFYFFNFLNFLYFFLLFFPFFILRICPFFSFGKLTFPLSFKFMFYCLFSNFVLFLIFPSIFDIFFRLTFQTMFSTFGQTWSWPNLVWPNLAKLGQTWIWPKLVSPRRASCPGCERKRCDTQQTLGVHHKRRRHRARAQQHKSTRVGTLYIASTDIIAAAALLEIDSTENMSTAAAHVKKETAMNIVQRKSHSDHTLAAQRGCRKGHLQDPTSGDEHQQHLREAQASLNFAWSQKQPRPELFLLGQPRSTERTPP